MMLKIREKNRNAMGEKKNPHILETLQNFTNHVFRAAH